MKTCPLTNTECLERAFETFDADPDNQRAEIVFSEAHEGVYDTDDMSVSHILRCRSVGCRGVFLYCQWYMEETEVGGHSLTRQKDDSQITTLR